MWTVFIIDGDPRCRDVPHFLQTPKQIQIKDLISIRPMEPLNERILRGAVRLNVIARHPIGLPLLMKLL